MLQGGADHFGAAQNGGAVLQPATYSEDGRPAQFPIGSYSSDFYAQRLIKYLDEEDESDRPFFAYLAFTAPHWPLQAPKALITSIRANTMPMHLPGSFILSEAFGSLIGKLIHGRDASARPRDRRAPSSWKLYNLSINAGESHDLSKDNPDVLKRLISVWNAYAQANGVFVPDLS